MDKSSMNDMFKAYVQLKMKLLIPKLIIGILVLVIAVSIFASIFSHVKAESEAEFSSFMTDVVGMDMDNIASVRADFNERRDEISQKIDEIYQDVEASRADTLSRH